MCLHMCVGLSDDNTKFNGHTANAYGAEARVLCKRFIVIALLLLLLSKSKRPPQGRTGRPLRGMSKV